MTYKELKKKQNKIKELRLDIADIKSHLNTNADFEANLKLLSPFKMKRPPQSWCYVESEVTE